MRGSDDRWLEYFAGRDEWQIWASSGKWLSVERSWAKVVCSSALQLPESCNGNAWKVYDGSEWNEQDDIVIEVLRY